MTLFRAEWFMFPMSPEVGELVAEILDELVAKNAVTLPEAVARVNAQWGGSDLSSSEDVVLHETAFFWAAVILYEEPIPDWWEGADRSLWRRRHAPPADSGCWTFAEPSE